MVYQHYGRSLMNLLKPIIGEYEEDPKSVMSEAAENNSLILAYDPLSERLGSVELWGVIGLAHLLKPEEDTYSLKSCITIDSTMHIGAMPFFEFSAEKFRTVLIGPEYQKAIIHTFNELYEGLKESIDEWEKVSEDYNRKKAEREELEVLPVIKRYVFVKGEESGLLIKLENLKNKMEGDEDFMRSLAAYSEEHPNYKQT